jgi:hypothetical protein
MAIVYRQCKKCRASLTPLLVSENDLEHIAVEFCDNCYRIKSWLPDIVAMVVEALKSLDAKAH